MRTLAISGPDAERLLGGLALVDETAWVLTARSAVGGHLLLGRELHDVPDEAYAHRGSRKLEITSTGFVPGFAAARRENGVAVFVHTHPGGDPRPSTLDEAVDAELARFAERRGLKGYGALILGGTPAAPRFTGRLFSPDGTVQPIEHLRVAGRRLRFLPRDDASGDEPPAVFDRQVRAFGQDGQRVLAALRVGVVGAGGTGSAVIEQLARLGVGQLVVVDDDTVDESNLTRIHEATGDDVGKDKAVVAKNRGEAFGTGTRIEAFVGTAASRAGVDQLLTCDVVFGCTDDYAGRLVLSRLAYHYLLPVIDCGVVVDAHDGTVRGVVGRVTRVAPGEPYLVCRGQVDPRRASEEMMDPEQRRALAGEGYAAGADAPAPAVVAFTTATAAFAVNELLAGLFGYAESCSPQVLLRMHAQSIARGGRPAADGHLCVTPEEWGLGDTEPLLGIVGLT